MINRKKNRYDGKERSLNSDLVYERLKDKAKKFTAILQLFCKINYYIILLTDIDLNYRVRPKSDHKMLK